MPCGKGPGLISPRAPPLSQPETGAVPAVQMTFLTVISNSRWRAGNLSATQGSSGCRTGRAVRTQLHQRLPPSPCAYRWQQWGPGLSGSLSLCRSHPRCWWGLPGCSATVLSPPHLQRRAEPPHALPSLALLCGDRHGPSRRHPSAPAGIERWLPQEAWRPASELFWCHLGRTVMGRACPRSPQPAACRNSTVLGGP